MDAFRNLLKGWVGKLLLVIFILPFAFFGIEGLFQSAGRSKAEIVVNGTEITKPEIDRAAEIQRRNLVQRMGGQIDPSVISLEMVRPSAVEFLVRKALLSQATDMEGLYVSQENAKSYVRAMPQFKDDSGEFSQRRLEQLLAQAGYSGTGFLDEVREELLVKQLESAITETAFVTPAELKRLVVLNNQKRDVATLEIKAADFRDQVEVTDEDIRIHYEANSSSFQTPEKAKVEYLHVTLEDFPAAEKVTEEDIEIEFQKMVAAAKDKERRRAQHILVEIGGELSEKEALEKIKEAQQAIEKGLSFDKAAEKYSDDIATSRLGGDLGFAGKGVYDQAFEDALYSLEVGGVSEIVKTEFGYHIIRLTEVDQMEMPVLEEERERIVSELKKAKAREALTMAIEDLNQKAFEHPDTLVDAAEIVPGAEIKTSDWITRAGGPGVLSKPQVTSKIFEEDFIEERVNSEAIELDNDEVVIVRVKDYKPASVKPLKEVRDQVKNAVVTRKAREKAAEVANKLLARLNTGATLEEVAEEIGKEWNRKEGVGRQNTELGREVVSKVFEIPEPAENSSSFDKVNLPSGNQMLVAVQRVQDGVYDLNEQSEQQIEQSMEMRFGQYDFGNYIETLKEKAEITRRQI
ncbi:MAG: SurA N-terminal domain-containing protein [Ketobacteraceae bacterium]|nr:SurA N-terminal domain-containing protein [Ketobacteraceae bacterium]